MPDFQSAHTAPNLHEDFLQQIIRLRISVGARYRQQAALIPLDQVFVIGMELIPVHV